MARDDDVITVVLTAENHLGYGAVGEHARAKASRAQERLRGAFQQATDFAVGQGVDLFLQAGDLFDTPGPSEEDRGFVAARLAELRQAGVRVFAVSGIHDTPGERGLHAGDEDAMTGSEGSRGHIYGAPAIDGIRSALSAGPAPQVSYARLGALHYFPPVSLSRDSDGGGTRWAASLEPVMIDVRGVLVAVCGLSVCADEEGDPLANCHVSSEVERAAVSLLLLHAPIEDVASEEGGVHAAVGGRLIEPRRLMASVPEVARATITGQSSFGVMLAGYAHAYRRMRCGQCDVVVAGGTLDDAGEEPGFVFLGIAADGVRWCQHIAVEGLRVRRLVVDAAELWRNVRDDEESARRGPTEGLLSRLDPLCTADSVVQLSLVGELSRDRYHQLDFGRIRGYGEERCFDLAIDESGLSLATGDSDVVFAEDVEGRLSGREELVSLADEWIAEASDEQEKRALIATKEELLAALDGMKARRM